MYKILHELVPFRKYLNPSIYIVPGVNHFMACLKILTPYHFSPSASILLTANSLFVEIRFVLNSGPSLFSIQLEEIMMQFLGKVYTWKRLMGTAPILNTIIPKKTL